MTLTSGGREGIGRSSFCVRETLEVRPRRSLMSAAMHWAIVYGKRMRAVHILRKYNPAQWGGTETAVLQLTNGLREHGVSSTFFAPELEESAKSDPLSEAGHVV